MDATRRTASRATTIVSPRRRMLRALFEWWWNLDRRRHIAQLADEDRLHPLDESYVVEAMARQLEAIRNLPEVSP
jgi:hypothetical protein